MSDSQNSHMKKKDDILSDIERLHDAVLAAQEHFQVYRSLTNDEYRKAYTDTMNRYLGFFACTISAHFTALLLCLTKVFDDNPRNKRVSFYSVLGTAKAIGHVSENDKRRIEKELESDDLRAMVKKLSILRHNQFAHLGQMDAAIAFQKVGISPNDIKNIIEKAKVIVNLLARAVDGNSYMFGLDAEGPTVSLLKHLKQSHEIK